MSFTASVQQRWQRLAVWLSRLSERPGALTALFIFAALDVLVVPLPVSMVLLPWMLAEPKRSFRLASVVVAGNVVAAALGYLVGALAMEHLGTLLITVFGSEHGYAEFEQYFNENGFVAILVFAITPLPIQLAMLGAGATGYSFLLFLLATLLGRGLRYYSVALLILLGGDAALALWRRHTRPILILMCVALGIWAGWYWLS
ncbi:YqaA family protein [Phytohalomonas tamaricis]|uniref:YqaA family protein n=1 Tax=Phytohalomonas tamaricis TaxID=2081032 RepID=UPI0021D415D0|nr:VTT domain-containing protein [Phytohalomonas tamaricis]